jgi:hypothetical protein
MMTPTFRLWNLYQEHTRLVFDISSSTLMYGIHQGTLPWVQQCLQAFGVTAPVATWSIQAGRSFYYSDYPHEAAWQDRWVKTWHVAVSLTAPIDLPIPQDYPTIRGTNFLDTTWDDTLPDDVCDQQAFLLFDWRTDDSPHETRQAHVLATVAAQLPDSPQDITVRTMPTQIMQLRFRIARHGLFPEAVSHLDAIVRTLQQPDIATNWRNTLPHKETATKHLPELEAWMQQFRQPPERDGTPS